MNFWLAVILLASVNVINGEETFKGTEVAVTGRIFMYLEDGKDDWTSLQTDDGRVDIFPSSTNGKVTASGIAFNNQTFQVDLMHPTTIETVFQSQVLGEADTVYFYVNNDTSLSYEAKSGEMQVRQKGDARVKVTRHRSNLLKLHVNGDVLFVEQEEKRKEENPST